MKNVKYQMLNTLGGFVDPFTLFGVVFIVITLTLAVPQVLKIQNINEKAAIAGSCDSYGTSSSCSGQCSPNGFKCKWLSASSKCSEGAISCASAPTGPTASEVVSNSYANCAPSPTYAWCGGCGGFCIKVSTTSCNEEIQKKCGEVAPTTTCNTLTQGAIAIYTGIGDCRKCNNGLWERYPADGSACNLADLTIVPVYLESQVAAAKLAKITPAPAPTQSNASQLAQLAQQQYAAIPKCTFTSPRCSSDGKNIEICNSSGEMLSASCGTFGCTNGKCNPPVLVLPTPKATIKAVASVATAKPVTAVANATVVPKATIVAVAKATVKPLVNIFTKPNPTISAIAKGDITQIPKATIVAVANANTSVQKPNFWQKYVQKPTTNLWNLLNRKTLTGNAVSGTSGTIGSKTTTKIESATRNAQSIETKTMNNTSFISVNPKKQIQNTLTLNSKVSNAASLYGNALTFEQVKALVASLGLSGRYKYDYGIYVCGPLSAQILIDAGILPKSTNINDLYFFNPDTGMWRLNKIFPSDKFTRINTYGSGVSLAKYDWKNNPLKVGDWLSTEGGTFGHMFVVSEISPDGKVYAVMNYVDSNVTGNNNQYNWNPIGKVLIWDQNNPNNPDAMFNKWSDPSLTSTYGSTGRNGFILQRQKEYTITAQANTTTVADKIINAANNKMETCSPGLGSFYNACSGELYMGNILPTDQQPSVSPTNWSSEASKTGIYWCTYLVMDAAKAAGINITPNAWVPKMYEDFNNKGVIIPENIITVDNITEIVKPGMVAFIKRASAEEFAHVGLVTDAHVAIVTDENGVQSTLVYVTIVQSNAATLTNTFEFDAQGRLVTSMGGADYVIDSFGDLENYGN